MIHLKLKAVFHVVFFSYKVSRSLFSPNKKQSLLLFSQDATTRGNDMWRWWTEVKKHAEPFGILFSEVQRIHIL